MRLYFEIEQRDFGLWKQKKKNEELWFGDNKIDENISNLFFIFRSTFYLIWNMLHIIKDI